MRNKVFKKVKLDNLGQGCWATTERPTLMALMVNHESHTIALRKLAGPDPHFKAVFNLLLSDRDCAAELRWAAMEFRRKYPSNVIAWNGYSGCYTAKVVVDFSGEGGEFLKHGIGCKTVASIHISCGDSMYGVSEIFSGDLLDLICETCNITSPEELENALHMKRRFYTYMNHRFYLNGDEPHTMCGCLADE